MPAKSGEQYRFMAMCASEKGRKKAEGDCPPKSVAKEYVKETGKKLRKKFAKSNS